MYVEVSFCFVPFRFNAFAGFVSGFRTSRKLGAWTGDRFSFSVARDQMLVAWGDRAPLEHSLQLHVHVLLRRVLNSLEETDRAVIESISIGFPSTYRFVYIWVSDTFAYSAPQQ